MSIFQRLPYCVASLLPLIMLLLPLQAVDVTWTGPGGGGWATDSSWDTGIAPADGDNAFINAGAVDFSASSGTTEVLRALYMQDGASLAISGGELLIVKNANVASTLDGSVVQTGGRIDVNAVEFGRSATSNSFYSISDGEFNVGRAVEGFSIFLGGSRSSVDSGEGTFLISGGAFETRAGIKLGDATFTGNGTFVVLGSNISGITIARDGGGFAGDWVQNAGSTLELGVDSGGVTPIFVNDATDTMTGASATFEAGSLLDVDYHTITEGGGTWVAMEVVNGDIIDNGLAFAPGVDTSIWSFSIDNSGANGLLLVSAVGDPIGHELTISATQQQQMRYGIDYERLWFWTGGLNESERRDVARWSMADTDVDFVRVAINSGYELTEGTYNLSAYTNKIIPMMEKMQEANPDVKFFASPRPLNEAVSGVAWQPYPQWVTGSTGNSSNFDFDWQKCAEYLERYILLMKSYGFKISFLDITNEWQSIATGSTNSSRINSGDVRDIANYLKANLDAEDVPLIVGASAWNYQQGGSWIDSVNTNARREAVDIASSHNTDRTGDAATFAAKARAQLGDDVEIWNTEVHGWKSTSSENETTSFYYYLEAIRAGFSGLSGWLAIGTTNQGHAYILNPSGTPTRNVKHYIFQKLSSTSNYGYALDIATEPALFTAPLDSDDDDIPRNVAAFVKGDLMTVWVVNENAASVPLIVSADGHTFSGNAVRRTRWTDPSDVEGFVTYEQMLPNDNFATTIPGESVCCFEITLDSADFLSHRIEAEDYSHQFGTVPETSGDVDGVQNLGGLRDGDWVRYGEVTLSKNSTVSFRVARTTGRPDGFIRIREGSSDGPILGEVDVPETGGWQTFQTIETQLTNEATVANLYVQFVQDGTTGDFVNLNWLSVNDDTVLVPSVSGLTASTVSSSQIDLAWDPAIGAESYTLERALSAAGPFTTVISGLTTTGYSDAGLTADQAYYYIVSAQIGSNIGDDSLSVPARTFEAGSTNYAMNRIEAEGYADQFDIGVETTADVDGVENICHTNNEDWSSYLAVALNEDSTVEFRVARPNGRPDGVFEVREGSTTGPLLGQVAIPVTGNWQNYETVSAELNVEAGIYDVFLVYREDATVPTGNYLANFNWFSVNNPTAPILEPPTNLQATATSPTSIGLTWDPPTGAVFYQISRSLTMSGPFTPVGATDQVNFTDTGLSPSTPYYYVVEAANTQGLGAPSNESSSTTFAELTPANLVIASCALTDDGADNSSFALSMAESAIGYSYQVMATSDLVVGNWQPVSAILSGNGGVLDFNFAVDATNSPLQFFRVQIWTP